MGKKIYWTGPEELDNTEVFKESLSTEFSGGGGVEAFLGNSQLSETSTGRRDFLKFMGFSLTAATLAACETPVIKAIPYVNKPEDITPGVANYYATTYYDGQDYANVMVKSREGRPILIKPNKNHGWEGGALNVRVNSSLLSLYDSSRVSGPMKEGQIITWKAADAELGAALAVGGRKVLVTPTVVSPSTQRAISAFTSAFGAEHVVYDAISYSGIRKANEADFGVEAIPQYDFSKAKTIVSVNADFLNTWLTANIYTAQYGKGRKPASGGMSKHYQFEANYSLTGSNADYRSAIKPSSESEVIKGLFSRLLALSGAGTLNHKDSGTDSGMLDKAAVDVWANRGSSLVIAGSNDSTIQRIVNAINTLLGNYGTTIDIASPLNLFKGDEEVFAKLIDDMASGAVGTVLFWNVNPAYNWPQPDKFSAAMSKVANSVSFNLMADETGSRCTYILPGLHFLESWNDFVPLKGRTDFSQPLISPLYNARAVQESLLKWAGIEMRYLDFVQETHALDVTAWNTAIHNGTLSGAASPMVAVTVPPAAVAPSLAVVDLSAAISLASTIISKTSDWEIALYQKAGIGAGEHASNPWLQELPDPVTKVTWDNYATMALSDVEQYGLNKYIAQKDHASVIKISANGLEMELPVFPQPGQMPGTIGIALGYGRGANGELVGKAAFQTDESGNHIMSAHSVLTPVGRNAFPLATLKDGAIHYVVAGAAWTPTGATYPLASTQIHSTVMGRESVLKETEIAVYLGEKDLKRGDASYNKFIRLGVHSDVNSDGKIDARDAEHIKMFDLWNPHPVEGVGHRWGMAIDLSSCTGCGACVTACHTENNVPVVGKDEVLVHRDMHWLRIDRFYSSDYSLERGEAEGVGVISSYAKMERPSDNPKAVHMPMMCQHCNHAPCETVCPVSATTHSNEGLNQMTYNRCIGTRYCANNCPYKVRRFNWFNYMAYSKFRNVNPAQDEMTRLVLNPDVTVRSRGVMEKCSMCVQRIQEGKLVAKKAGVPVADGSIVTACAEACSNDAIRFGDLNDAKSEVTLTSQDVRSYNVLEEVGTQPNIYYLTKVRNVETAENQA